MAGIGHPIRSPRCAVIYTGNALGKGAEAAANRFNLTGCKVFLESENPASVSVRFGSR
ncbi:hypothetical protein OKW30_002487 [Paraburkholderia sp. Clong3]